MVYFFKNNRFIPVFLIPVLAFLLWFKELDNPNIVELRYAMPLFELLSNFLGFSLYVKAIFGIVILVISAFYFNYIIDHYNMLKKKTFLPAFVFVLFFCSSPAFLKFQPIIPAVLFVLFGLNKLMRTYRQEIDLSDFFDASMMISIASLFYFPTLFLFPLVWVTLVVVRPYVWREWAVSFLGVIIPYLFVFTWYYYFDTLDVFVNEKLFYPSDFQFYTFNEHHLAFIVLVGVIILLSIFSLVKYFSDLPVNTIFSRNFAVVFVWLGLLSFLSYIFAPTSDISYLGFVFIPLSYYFSNLLIEQKKNWIAELMIFIMILAVVANVFYDELLQLNNLLSSN